MYYRSEMPQIIGEFDAEELNRRVESIAPTDANMSPLQIIHELDLIGDNTDEGGYEDLISVQWSPDFNFKGFGYAVSPTRRIEAIRNHRGDLGDDFWHVDLAEKNKRLFRLPKLVIGASKWPTDFLVGDIEVKLSQELFSPREFWKSELGKEAVEKAITSGDASRHKFKEGEVVKVQSGTLHRRDIPIGSSGYRYFLRLYSTMDLLHSGTVAGKLRFFR